MARLKTPVITLVFWVILCVPPAWAESLGLPPVPTPADNPQNPEKIALGQKLFTDKRLSADGSISCASCHDPENAFTDGLPVAAGLQKQTGTRNTPTLLNVAFNTSQFWDGRRQRLEDQAPDPFINPIEHGLKDQQAILDLLRQDPDYATRFKTVFNIDTAQIHMDHVAQALASFERSLIAADSPFDRYYYGGQKDALSPAAINGLHLFQGRAGCQGCHRIEAKDALFTDHDFHALGVGLQLISANLAQIALRAAQAKGQAVDASTLRDDILTDQATAELGRFNITFKPADIGRFKTPSLRNVALTAPYMHDGSIATLEAAIERELYQRGEAAGRPLVLTPLEKAELLAFLQALTGAGQEQTGLKNAVP